MRELQTALTLHEAGREGLRKRLLDQEQQLQQAAISADARVAAVEELRGQEMVNHKRRVQQVQSTVAEVLDQMRRARLNVDEWTRSTATYAQLASSHSSCVCLLSSQRLPG